MTRDADQTLGLRGALRSGRVTVGVTIGFAHAGLAELLGDLGFDAIVVDGEHGPVDEAALEGIAIACGRAGTALLLRIDADAAALERYRGIGVTGIQLPRTHSVEQVLAVVNAVKYAPIGRRGLGSSRATRYGLSSLGFAELMARANEETAILVQIEDRAGIAALPAILELETVDAVLIGVLDLSEDLGVPGQTQDPRVLAAVEEVVSRCREAGRPFGLGAYDEATAHAAVERGAGYLLTGVPRLLSAASNGMLAVRDVRAAAHRGGSLTTASEPAR